MPGWDGAGNVVRGDGTRTGNNTWAEALAAGVKILAASHDVHDQFLADAIENCLARDGQNAMAGVLNMDDHQIQNLTSGSALHHAVAVRQLYNGQFVWAGTAGGTADALTLTPTPAIAAYTAGMAFRFIAASTNTSIVTLNVSGLGALDVKDLNGRHLSPGRIKAGNIYTAIHDGSLWRVNAEMSTVTGPITASGVDVYFSGLVYPRQLILILDNISGVGTDDLELRLGDSGGYENSGYDFGGLAEINGTNLTSTTSTPGDSVLLARNLSAGSTLMGRVQLDLSGALDDNWIITSHLGRGTNGITELGICSKAVSSVAGLDRLRLMWSGSDTFDAGTATLLATY